jgi:hypothetical protein
LLPPFLCGSAYGNSRPAPEQARREWEDWVERQAERDARMIMAGMDAARIAALLARVSR